MITGGLHAIITAGLSVDIVCLSFSPMLEEENFAQTHRVLPAYMVVLACEESGLFLC